jgi:leucyl aminopeptidase
MSKDSLTQNFSEKLTQQKGALILCLAEGKTLPKDFSALDKTLQGALSRVFVQGLFQGKKKEILTLSVPAGSSFDHVILYGFGKLSALDEALAAAMGGALFAALSALKVKEAAVDLSAIKAKLSLAVCAANMAYGLRLRSYRFDHYKTKDVESSPKPTLKSVQWVGAKKQDATAAYQVVEALADGVFLARDLVSEPPNILYPDSYAERCKALAKFGLKVTVLDRKQLEKLGMGALLGVAQGSVRDARVVVLEWRGKPTQKGMKLALVGKGVTFDTGGISIKPASGMEDMKYDMGGSAAVVGTLLALAKRKAKVNVVGAIGLVENMPDGNAQRPSDVVTTMSGQTVEVLNTDAEGRLVLADVLWYVQQVYKPEQIVDLATLTGAIVISLGGEYSGLFSNDDKLSAQLTAAGGAVGERLWRFPMGEEYDKMLESQIADMANISQGRGAGSITAAQFLQRFIQKDVAWAHLDIAGSAWTKKDRDICPKGAVGFGVQLLHKFVAETHEKTKA